MIPISQAAKRYNLSRSTLLYYDRLGLVRPSYRTAAGYRLYQEEDLRRLETISRYRAAGLSLKAVKDVLDSEGGRGAATKRALHRRLDDLNREIAGLRKQQQMVLSLLGGGKRIERLARAMTKDKWVAMLREFGLSDEEMGLWHCAFERNSPEAHQDFLESLGIDAAEIRQIRAWSRSEVDRRA